MNKIIIGSIAYRYSYFGDGPGPHIITPWSCPANHKSLLDCSYSFSYAAQYCGDGDVAGVICRGRNFKLLLILL